MPELPHDQAHGLRRLFAHHTVHMVPVLANSQLKAQDHLLETLCSALAVQGMHTLVVDGQARRGPIALDGEFADLGAWVQDGADLMPLIDSYDPHTSYFAAGPTLGDFSEVLYPPEGLLAALAQSVPNVDVMLFRAPADHLAGLFGQSFTRPLIFTGNRPEAITESYAGIKTMVGMAGLAHFGLVVDREGLPQGGVDAGKRLSECVAEFLGGEVDCIARLDSAQHPIDPHLPEVQALARSMLHHALPYSLYESENGLQWAPQPHALQAAYAGPLWS